MKQIHYFILNRKRRLEKTLHVKAKHLLPILNELDGFDLSVEKMNHLNHPKTFVIRVRF